MMFTVHFLDNEQRACQSKGDKPAPQVTECVYTFIIDLPYMVIIIKYLLFSEKMGLPVKLVNKTKQPVTFTSVRFLMNRSLVRIC